MVRMRDNPPPVPGSLGLGDKVEVALGAVGFRPCGGCKERKDALNRITLSDPLDAIVEDAARRSALP